MAVLLADSGSTKTSWKLILNSNEVTTFETSGINPTYLSDSQIVTILTKELIPEVSGSIEAIQFYGAGCSQASAKEKLKEAFSLLFPKASIEIDTDLAGACKALSGDGAAWVCILGTGSNSCVYEQGKIIHQAPSLGYILGDDGSGQDIGKRLLKAYFLHQMPAELKAKWNEKYDISYSSFIEQVYQKPKANKWLASFAVFAKEQIEHPFIEELVLASFESFVSTYIGSQKEYAQLPLHFVGSVAFHFQQQLAKIVAKHDLTLGKIVTSPIEYLSANPLA